MTLRHAPNYWQYRGNRLTAAPAVEPVTLAEVKAHSRIVGTSDDAFLTDAIEEARQEIEDATGMAFITQSWQLTLDRWPMQDDQWWDGVRDGHRNMLEGGKASVYVPRYPLQSITSVTTYDDDGTSNAVVVADTFNVDTQQFPGRLTLQHGASWPVATQANNAIEVVYVAGYGATAADVPAPIKRAIRNMVGYMYEHRGDCSTGDAYEHSGAMKTMARYRARMI